MRYINTNNGQIPENRVYSISRIRGSLIIHYDDGSQDGANAEANCMPDNEYDQVIPASPGHRVFLPEVLGDGRKVMRDAGPVVAWGTDVDGAVIPMVPDPMRQKEGWWLLEVSTMRVTTWGQDEFDASYSIRDGNRVLVSNQAG